MTAKQKLSMQIRILRACALPKKYGANRYATWKVVYQPSSGYAMSTDGRIGCRVGADPDSELVKLCDDDADATYVLKGEPGFYRFAPVNDLDWDVNEWYASWRPIDVGKIDGVPDRIPAYGRVGRGEFVSLPSGARLNVYYAAILKKCGAVLLPPSDHRDYYQWSRPHYAAVPEINAEIIVMPALPEHVTYREFNKMKPNGPYIAAPVACKDPAVIGLDVLSTIA